MIAYLDSSVILRVVLRQPKRLKEWKSVRSGISSALVEVECLRTLDRLRQAGVTHEVYARAREAVYRMLDEIEIVELDRSVLTRAALPLPVPLGTLDAIHLATAVLYRERNPDLVMATHDQALATAARAFGLPVVGS